MTFYKEKLNLSKQNCTSKTLRIYLQSSTCKPNSLDGEAKFASTDCQIADTVQRTIVCRPVLLFARCTFCKK